MKTMQMLASLPAVERLGTTLLHFLWQGFTIAFLYAAARRAGRRWTPNARYLLACASLTAMLAAPLVTWEVIGPSEADVPPAYRIANRPASASSTGASRQVAPLPASVRAAVSGVQPAPLLSWVVMLWFAGAVVFSVRLAGAAVVAARMRSRTVRSAPPEWQETLAALGRRIGLLRPVRLLVSALVEVPMVVGWLRPVVLLPVGALGGVPADYLEALLLHELAHIRRRDALVNMLQGVVEALLFYHPAVWWVSGHIRVERELCCDDVAAAAAGSRLTYARALAHVESHRPAHLNLAMAANGGRLSDRIARLLGQARPAIRTGPGPGTLVVAVLLGAAAYGLFAQPDSHPAFEVASIKPSPHSIDVTRDPVGVGYKPGGRLVATNTSLKLLIQFAYAPHDSPHSMPLLGSQVVGPPGWIDTQGWNIEAKPAGTTDPKHAWLMLQTLLADRFKLALHREVRELPIYELRVAKSGLKIGPPKEVACVSFPPGTPPARVPGKVDCGYVGVAPGPNGTRMRGNRVHMSDVTRELSTLLDRPVVDQTGFPGEFDIDLTFTPDDAIRLPLYGAGGRVTPTDPDQPNLFAALEEQMGLKLVAAKGPVEVLAIAHAERPAQN